MSEWLDRWIEAHWRVSIAAFVGVVLVAYFGITFAVGEICHALTGADVWATMRATGSTFQAGALMVWSISRLRRRRRWELSG